MSTINETTNDPEFDLPEDLDESQFDDPEDFVDDISDEGIYVQGIPPFLLL